MTSKEFSNSNNTVSDPASRRYDKNLKEKAHEQSPFGADEPSPHTTFKKKRH